MNKKEEEKLQKCLVNSLRRHFLPICKFRLNCSNASIVLPEHLAAKNVLMGYDKGFPDLTIFLMGALIDAPIIYIELKFGANKRSKEQLEFADLVKAKGAIYLCLTGYEETFDKLNELLYGLLVTHAPHLASKMIRLQKDTRIFEKYEL